MNNDNESPLHQRWGDLLDGGFVLIPTLLLKRQRALDLLDGELITLQHLLSAWWEQNDLPTLGAARIAAHMGTSQRTVQRHLCNLVKKGMIRATYQPSKSNPNERVKCFDPAPAVQKLRAIERSRQLSEIHAPKLQATEARIQ